MHERTNAQTQRARRTIAPCAILIYTLLFCPLSASANNQQPESGNRQLFSTSVAQRFHEIAYELAGYEDASPAEIEQAVIFLKAAMKLDADKTEILPDLISLLTKHIYLETSEYETPDTFLSLLTNYVDRYNKDVDLQITTKATQYLLDQLDSREQREQLLQELLKTIGDKNPGLDSQLYTSLGLLMAEKADANNASVAFMNACNKNKYNKLAFIKLAELIPDRIPPAAYLEHLRLALTENPLNLDAALAFAQYLEQLQLYQIAADAYQYCADLFTYLYPSQPLPPSLYIPWEMTCYNTQQNLHKCPKIAEQLRQSGLFDLRAEAIAAKAADKIGDAEKAKQIRQNAEAKAQADWLLETANRKFQIASQLAWFYCFAAPDADKALDWANKAFSTDPNSQMAASILAYSLVMKDQPDLAKLLIDKYQHNQIANLALAKIQLAKDQQATAIQTLKAAIASDPASLAAQQAKEILAQQGQQYIPPSDPNITLTQLKNTLGQTLVPEFLAPDKIISVQLDLRSSKPLYGSKFGATLAIKNNSSEPLIISDDALFKGNIRVDANITSDLNKKLPNLISLKTQPALPIESGKSLLIPLRLFTGELRRTLLTYPQASLNIEFTAYLDPITTAQGRTNRLADIKPAKLAVDGPASNSQANICRTASIPSQKPSPARISKPPSFLSVS